MQIRIGSSAEFRQGLPRAPLVIPPDLRHVRLEALWRLVRRWAARTGQQYLSTYGVVGSGPV